MLTVGCGTIPADKVKDAVSQSVASTPEPTPIYVTEDYPNMLVLVNAQNPLPDGFKPNKVKSVKGAVVEATAAGYLLKLLEAARADGVDGLYIKNGYRSAASQGDLYRKKVAEYEEEYGKNAPQVAVRIVALPGTSEHQTGLAVDFGTGSKPEANLKTVFAYTDEGKWLAKNAYKYGFDLRYPPNKEKLTGVIYEPWHFRFVGMGVAEVMQSNGISLEEYLKWKKSGRVVVR